MRYRVRRYCGDCCGTDDYGCFEGSSELLEEPSYPYETREFPSPERAEAAGWESVRDCGPWEFYVVDEEDIVIFDSANT